MFSCQRIPWLAIVAFVPLALLGSATGRAAQGEPTLTDNLVITINGQTFSFLQEAAKKGEEKFVKLGTPPKGEDRYIFSIPRRKLNAQTDLTDLAWKQSAGCDGIPSYKEGEVSGVVNVSMQPGKPPSPTLFLSAG